MAIIQGGASGIVADVNANKELLVALNQDVAKAGITRIADSEGRPILTTESGALDMSIDNLLFIEQVDGTALNTNVWMTSVSGMTIAQANGFITLNSGLATTAGAYAILTSIKNMPLYGFLPLRVSHNSLVNILPEINATIEQGIGLCATNAAPTDGAFFRWNSSAQFRCVVSTGGVETVSDPITAPAISDAALFDIILVEDIVRFRIDDVIVADVDPGAGFAYPTSSGRLPIFARVYNGGSAPSIAPQLNIGQVIGVQQAVNQLRPWADNLASIGRGAYQSPVTPFGQTANHANSTSPTSGSLSNTIASYTTMGGRYQFAAPGAAVTDFALFAFQVPAGYQLFVTGVTISGVNTGAAVGVSATILDWSLGINASNQSLATTDGAGTWAPRRIPLGTQSYAGLGAIGLVANDIQRTFSPPLVVDAGRFLHVILQVPVGLATGSQILRGDVTIQGYFE